MKIFMGNGVTLNTDVIVNSQANTTNFIFIEPGYILTEVDIKNIKSIPQTKRNSLSIQTDMVENLIEGFQYTFYLKENNVSDFLSCSKIISRNITFGLNIDLCSFNTEESLLDSLLLIRSKLFLYRNTNIYLSIDKSLSETDVFRRHNLVASFACHELNCSVSYQYTYLFNNTFINSIINQNTKLCSMKCCTMVCGDKVVFCEKYRDIELGSTNELNTAYIRKNTYMELRKKEGCGCFG